MDATPAISGSYFQFMMAFGSMMKYRLNILLLWVAIFLCNVVNALDLQAIEKKTMLFPQRIERQADNDENSMFRSFFQVDHHYSWILIASETDRTGTEHRRYMQLIDGIAVNNAVIVLHKSENPENHVTGIFVRLNSTQQITVDPGIRKTEIINKFLPAGSELLNDDPNSGWQWLLNDSSSSARLGFILNYFPENSLHKHALIIDAVTLTKVKETSASCYADVTGTAVTSYHGVKSISCFADSGQFYLKSTTKGLGVFTRNLNHQLNYQHISDFSDADNYWQPGAAAAENHATDAHYCAERYYDYLNTQFSRNSIDNNGFKLISYLNYGTTLANAFWNGQAVVYGSGNGTVGPLTTTDIAGHEFTHGLIQKTANLVYSGEPGTVNEALSDIFGVALEHYANPQQADWLIGEMAGSPLRSFSNPGDFNQPSFYHGNFWYYGTGDQGGVHINSGFINKWFYIIANGEQGTNETGAAYHVNGMGMTASMDLVYHALTSYLLPNSGFAEFYLYTLQSAIDLYGNCSPEYESVLKAWEAVGYGNDTVVPQIILAGPTSFCYGDSVLIKVNHQAGAAYEWFHDGTLISGLTTPEIYATVSGSWFVKISLCGRQLVSDPVSLHHFPAVQVTTESLEICQGPPAVLEGYPAGGVFSIPNPYFGYSTSFEYTYTDSNGCASSAQGYVTVRDLPVVTMLTPSCDLPQNAGPLQLEANVQGTFYGIGVSGNQFFPETAGIGGSYTIYVFYSNQFGCSAHDSTIIKVTEPCVTAASDLYIQASDAVIVPKKEMTFHVNVSTEDFRIEWQFPKEIIILGNNDQSLVNVIWGDADGVAVLLLINSCKDTLRLEYRVDVNQIEALPVCRIYPNPAKGFLFVELNGFENLQEYEIKISDISGKQVLQQKTTSLLNRINIHELTTGYYLVEIRNGTKLFREKLAVN